MAALAVLAAGVALPGLEEVSWAAGVGSFAVAVVALVVALLSGPRDRPPSTAVPGGRAPEAPAWVDDDPIPVTRVDPRALGVHAALPTTRREGLPSYVPREVDSELDAALDAAGDGSQSALVLVTGPSTAGKSRSLVEAVQRRLPERILVHPPEHADLTGLPEWLHARKDRAPQGWVLWLDDLDRRLGAAGLDPALVDRLARANVIVAATIRQDRLELLRPAATGDPDTLGTPVLRGPALRVHRDWSAAERDRARDSGDDRLMAAADDLRFGVAEYLAAGPRLEETWLAAAEGSNPRGFAVVAAAVDLERVGLSAPLTRDQILSAHEAYLPGPPPLPEPVGAAWSWATEVRSGTAGLLVPADHAGTTWRAFDYLTTDAPIPDATWQAALHLAEDMDRLVIGASAYVHDRADIAEHAWLPIAATGNTRAMFNLGHVFYARGDFDGAAEWYGRAAAAGESEAMNWLGRLESDQGHEAEAQRWYRRAAEEGNTTGMVILGLQLMEDGDLDTAAAWWRRAAADGDGDTAAMRNLGVFLQGNGRLDEAEQWLRRSTADGSPRSMLSLGLLLEERDRSEEAEHWLRRAAELDEAGAMTALGVHLHDQGATDEAEAWHRRAAGNGDAVAMFNLGVLHSARGDTAGAADWWGRAAQQGYAPAMFNLGLACKEARQFAEAEHWVLRVALEGDTNGCGGLGELLHQQGDTEQAAFWYRRAIEEGSLHAMVNLGVLLSEQGRPDAAEAWYRRAAEAGTAHAMRNLAALLYKRGARAEARRWWRRAKKAS
ncbi:tetratricopeptide repeat protein [Lipingzhangella sp. LS1_29]|uniref:Tetratricopeptide repeat protein n=1 Tax=Lipingzhangella rawalii TaxID=2055835 RepID=A0ABU2HBV5_9ACTN|nr:tetratricopeptide repeat protein [Lipingzhangella rawalii]MDS1272285.1 tetratricopeptide repeat protein [Lipingzhangella rawalii]